MKRLTAVLYLILFSTITYAKEVTDILIKEREQSVFVLQCFNEKNQLTTTSTGFFIDQNGLALTNVHVFKDAYRAKIQTSNGKIYDVEKVVDYNPSLDIAKIYIKKNGNASFTPIRLAKKAPEKGEEIFTLFPIWDRKPKFRKALFPA